MGTTGQHNWLFAGAVFMLAAPTLLVAGPALADVKAGVDAWTRGDYAAAIREWQAPAAKGDPDAMFNLGQAYKLGRGVKQDLAKAEELFGKAAALGHLQASDNYGVLLFQRGERARALPYIRAGADRGDPRAQYLLGVSHFNGENVPRDWVRAYALTSLAQQAGLAQAAPALAQMDQQIPLAQRQQAATLAVELASQAEATRARQLASADLGTNVPASPSSPPAVTIRTTATPQAAPVITASPAKPITARPSIAAAENAVTEAVRMAGTESPAAAGADYARPQPPRPQPPRPQPPTPVARPLAPVASPRPASAAAATPVTVPRPAPAPATAASSGPWRVQLGAFSVIGNAESLWNRVKSRPELSGHGKLLVRAGAVTKLQAGGFASQADAQAACSRLAAAGFSCLALRN